MFFPPKFTGETIAATCRAVEGSVVALVNQDFRDENVVVIDCRRTTPAELDAFPIGAQTFVYGCDQDDIGLPFIARLVERGDKFIPVPIIDPSLYFHIDNDAHDVIEAEWTKQSEGGFDNFGNYGVLDFLNIMQAIETTSDISGDYVEIGCYRGSSGCAALAFMARKNIGRRCYFFDVFEGFTYPEAYSSSDFFWHDTHQTEGRDVVAARLGEYQRADIGLTVSVTQHNIIVDALPDEIETICIANIDVDIYEAVLQALRKVHPRMAKCGIIILEDAGHTPLLIGARLALHRFLQEEGAGCYTVLHLQSGQSLLVRR